MVNDFRSGAGAPNRDKNGQIQAVRRRLISNPKYQHVNINVDDDFQEAQNQAKNLGLINFKRGNSPVRITDNNNNNNNNNNFYEKPYLQNISAPNLPNYNLNNTNNIKHNY